MPALDPVARAAIAKRFWIPEAEVEHWAGALEEPGPPTIEARVKQRYGWSAEGVDAFIRALREGAPAP